MNENKKQKNIPNDWQEKKLKDVLKIGSGKDYKHLRIGNIPVFGTGGYMLSVDDFLCSGETVFIGRKGTIDKPFYFKGKFWTVDTLFYTCDYRDTNARYVNYIFQKINWKLYNEASGVPSLSKATIERIKFIFPSLPEQNRIVSVLETWDKAIEKLAKKIEFKKNIKKGLMQRLLTGGLRLPGFSKPWSYIKIRDLAGLIKGDKSKGGDNGYLEIGDVDINSKSYNIVGKEKLTVPGAIKVPRGTLLISTVRPTRGAITITKESIFVSSAFCKLKIDNFFTYFIVNSETFLNYLGDNSGGGTYPTCKNEDVLEYEFLAPAVVEERIAIANILKTAEQEVEVLEHKLNCFKQQKNYLLNNLITGAIRTPKNLLIK